MIRSVRSQGSHLISINPGLLGHAFGLPSPSCLRAFLICVFVHARFLSASSRSSPVADSFVLRPLQPMDEMLESLSAEAGLSPKKCFIGHDQIDDLVQMEITPAGGHPRIASSVGLPSVEHCLLEPGLPEQGMRIHGARLPVVFKLEDATMRDAVNDRIFHRDRPQQ